MSKIKSQHAHTAVLTAHGMEDNMFRYARLLSDNRNVRLHHIPIPAIAVAHDEAVAVAETRKLFSSTELNLVLSEWLESPRAMQNMIQLTRSRCATGIFFRIGKGRNIRRIVVAVGGGPNLYEQLWLADALAKHHRLPVAVLNWADGIRNTFSSSTPAIADLEKICVQQLGLEIEIFEYSGPSLVDAVQTSLRSDDLLIIGAPSPLRLATDFTDSLPDQLEKKTENPLIMLARAPQEQNSLHRLFWGQLANPDLKVRNKEDALEKLVDNLIRHHQLPPGKKHSILERALKREQISSSAVDCDTAFPHVALPGFYGVAGSMAICLDGVDFGSPSGKPAHFLFLLITPEGYCSEYLAILSKISKRMIDPAVRTALLKASSQQEILNILEPAPDEQHVFGTSPLRHRKQHAKP